MDLRAYTILDALQPQVTGFLHTISQGFMPLAQQASLFLEIAPGIAINRLTDVALKATTCQPGMQIVERAYGMLELHDADQGQVRAAGEAILRAMNAREADRLRPRIVSSQIITGLDGHQAQLINRMRHGDMIVAGEALYILEVHPAGYAGFAANEAEKASPIDLLEFVAFGAFGRLWLGGGEAEIHELEVAQPIPRIRLDLSSSRSGRTAVLVRCGGWIRSAQQRRGGSEDGMVAPVPIMQTTGLRKTYGKGAIEVHALREVDLVIEAGEFVAIMGPSGSGKTTLMNILGCLDRPTAGSYRLLGREVATLDANQLAEVRNRMLGFVFQNFNLLARTSALENVQLPLVYAGTPATLRRRRASEALAQVGLADRMMHHPSELSGGQQQRVAIARALVGRPRVILADEPTGNLDSQTSMEILGLFQDLGAAGMTIVYVTHEADIASFASRVLTVKDGRIESDRRQIPATAGRRPRAVAEPSL
jgi:putative ABC transport system ATP-binding protein